MRPLSSALIVALLCLTTASASAARPAVERRSSRTLQEEARSSSSSSSVNRFASSCKTAPSFLNTKPLSSEELLQIVPDEGTDEERAVRSYARSLLQKSGTSGATFTPRNYLNHPHIVGTGIAIQQKGKFIAVVAVLPASAGYQAGVRTDDLIISVNGAEMQPALSNMLAELPLLSPSQPLLIEIRRDSEKKVLMVSPEITYGPPVPKMDVRYIQGFAVITLGILDETVIADLRKLVYNAYPKAKGIVLDIRTSPGGILEANAVVHSLMFSKNSAFGRVHDLEYGKNCALFTTENPILPTDYPVTVVVSRNTMLSAELLAAAIQEGNRGVIIGEVTAGRTDVSSMYQLPDGSTIQWKIGKLYPVSGVDIEGKGVIPDILIPSTGPADDAPLFAAISEMQKQFPNPSNPAYPRRRNSLKSSASSSSKSLRPSAKPTRDVLRGR